MTEKLTKTDIQRIAHMLFEVFLSKRDDNAADTSVKF